MQKGISKNENRKKLTVLVDTETINQMKKEVIDLDCSLGEFIENMFAEYKKTKEK